MSPFHNIYKYKKRKIMPTANFLNRCTSHTNQWEIINNPIKKSVQRREFRGKKCKAFTVLMIRLNQNKISVN